MALAVTCLLSLIPMKVPAMNPFWQQEAFRQLAEAPSLAALHPAPPMVATLDPVAPQTADPGSDAKLHAASHGLLYAGIRANPRIPVKRVRQIALPPPTSFHLRAPPARV